MIQSHHLISNTTFCSRIRPRVKNHTQCNFISCTPLNSRDLKNIPGFHYDLLSEQHTTTRYVSVKTDDVFVHLHRSTQSIVKKVLSFHLILTLHLHQYRIGRLKQKKVELYKTLCFDVRLV